MPEAFHARFQVTVSLRPSAEHVSACGRRNEAPDVREKKPLVPKGRVSYIIHCILKIYIKLNLIYTAVNHFLKHHTVDFLLNSPIREIESHVNGQRQTSDSS